ncbi:MAG: hypothetical protein KDC45_01835 [Bacteroidetes bacterium]|nr:hypothetical protein [Bacteroidota bacterium]
MKRLFNYIVLLFVLVSPILRAGGSSYSSSRYGLIEFRPSIRSMGMGGVILAIPGQTSTNYYNPAGLIGLTATRFEGSLYYQGNQATTRNGGAFSDLTHLNQVSFALPFGSRFAAAFSLARYSSVDYRYAQAGSFQNEPYTEKYTGDGGMRQLAFSFAWKAVPSTSVGLSAQYFMGSISRHWVVNWTSTEFEGSDDLIQENIRGVRWVAGAIHSEKDFDYGMVIAPPAGMQRDEAIQNATGDTTSYRRVNEGLPFELGLGAAYRGFNQYVVGADLVFSAWSAIKPFGQSQKHQNTIKVALGAERLPSTSISAGYFDLWSYRAGFYFQNLYASSATGKFGSEYFLTTGATIPFNRGRNQLDVAIEVGQRGSIGGFRVRDRITRISIAVSGGERWFQNRKKRQ